MYYLYDYTYLIRLKIVRIIKQLPKTINYLLN